MKKSSWFLLIAGGILSLLFLVGAGGYYFRVALLERFYKQEGNGYMRKKNYPKAIETYTKLANLNNKSLTAYMGRGQAYYYSGRYEEAIEDCNHALTFVRVNKNITSCYLWRGGCNSAENRWDAAIYDYSSALIYSPYAWDAYRLRGYAYAKTRHFELALRDANEAIRRHPEALTFETRGFVYGEMEQHAKALADCLAAANADPDSRIAWSCLGWEQYKAGQWQEAERSDRRALEINGNVPTPRFNLGLCFAVQNNTIEAKKEYALALAGSKASQRDPALIELKKAQAEHPNTSAIADSLLLFAAAKSNAPQKKSLYHITR